MDANDPTGYRYWAFISYSSKDGSWAHWLRRAIEAYGVPARLVSHPTPAGDPAPKRFRPLFHDRAELSAAADLGVEIEDALRTSRYLISICSPHAARSEWVNKEIETFQRVGSSERILAVIVDGEPNVGGERECLPIALRDVELIMADARPGGDGKRDAKLKLMAGMLGVGFDALRQRDAHRRLRRLQVGIVLALALVLGFAGLAAYAENQRVKAVKARQQAESVLEYLLFDLRDELRPVGRLDILQSVQAKVDAYFAELGTDAGDPYTFRNRAAAFSNEGDSRLTRGDLSGALRNYQAALAIDERLASSDPSNVDWQWDSRANQTGVGDVLKEKGDLPGALKMYRAALAIDMRLTSSDPSNADWQDNLSADHDNVGRVLEEQADMAGALQEYRAGLAIDERLAVSDPSDLDRQWSLSTGHSDVGDALKGLGDLPGALREYRAGYAIMQRLTSSDPSNTGWQRDMSVSHSELGGVLFEQHDMAGALKEYRAGYAIMQRLGLSDPSNRDWMKLQADLGGRVDEVLRIQGETSR